MRCTTTKVRTCLTAGLLCFWLEASSAGATAQATNEEVVPRQALRTQLNWAGSACRDVGPLRARVLGRSQRVRFVESKAELTLGLVIEEQREGFDATLTLRDQKELVMSRRLASSDCAELLDAVALVAAIALEGRPRAEPSVPQAPPTSADLAPSKPRPRKRTRRKPARGRRSTTRKKPPVQKSEAQPVAAQPSEPKVKLLPPPVPASRAEVTPTVALPVRAGRWFAGVGADARTALGIAPSLVFGAEVWLRLGWQGRAGSWAPHLEASYQALGRDDNVVGAGRADFSLRQWGLALCPFQWTRERLRWTGCGIARAGGVTTRGERLFSPRAAVRPWRAVGLSGRLSGEVVESLHAVATLELATPLVRDTYVVGGASDTHQAAPVIASFGFGLTWGGF